MLINNIFYCFCYNFRDPTTAAQEQISHLAVIYQMPITRHAYMQGSTLVALMGRLCQDRFGLCFLLFPPVTCLHTFMDVNTAISRDTCIYTLYIHVMGCG